MLLTMTTGGGSALPSRFGMIPAVPYTAAAVARTVTEAEAALPGAFGPTGSTVPVMASTNRVLFAPSRDNPIVATHPTARIDERRGLPVPPARYHFRPGHLRPSRTPVTQCRRDHLLRLGWHLRRIMPPHAPA